MSQDDVNIFLPNPPLFNACRVCGIEFEDYYPWGETGVEPTFDICPNCGVEFGYSDCTFAAITTYREKLFVEGSVTAEEMTTRTRSLPPEFRSKH